MTGGSERSDGRQAHVSRHSAGDFFNVPTTSMYSGVSADFSIPLSSRLGGILEGREVI